MSTSESPSALVLELAEEFLERYRQGQRPSLKEYVDRHPELYREILEVFPAMAMMENIAIGDESLAGDPTEAHGTTATNAPLPEQIGDFRIIREIGHGGMGVVYEAEQISLGRHVALKILPPQMVRDRRQRLRFEREAKAAAKLHHTNIVPVFGVGEHEGTAFYAMQYIQGLGLDQVIEELKKLRPSGPGGFTQSPHPIPSATQEELSAADMARSLLTGRFESALLASSPLDGPLDSTDAAAPSNRPVEQFGGKTHGAGMEATSESFPPRSFSGSSSSVLLPGARGSDASNRGRPATYWQSVARVGQQVAEALEYAHKQGILHRDIKPSNLLLDTQGTVWVTDFGLAKADDQQNLTHTGDILGTLRYMPPEAFDGKSDLRGDVYSLGLTLYEMLAFRPAFDQKDRGKLISQVTGQEPMRLARLDPGFPRDLDTIIHKAIDRDPDHRYATASALAADLQRFLDDEPIQARRRSLLERLARWRRWNKSLAAALAITVVALVWGTVVSGMMAIRANRYADRADRSAQEATLAAAAAVRSAAAESESARAARAESARQAAARGLALIEQSDSARGMLWLVRALELDPEDASGIHHAVRINVKEAAEQQLPTPWLTLRPEGLKPVTPGHLSVELVWDIAFSPDGRTLATLHRNSRQVRLWSTDDGRALGPPFDHKPAIPFRLAFSPDGHQLWVGCWSPTRQQNELRTELRTWDVASRSLVGTPLVLPGTVATFQPDVQAIAVHLSNVTTQVVDRQTGKPLGPVLNNPSNRGGPPEASFSPDGRFLALGESNYWEQGVSRAALVWDVRTGKLQFQTGKHDSYHIYAVAWSPDGRTIATGGHDQLLRFWDATTGVLKGHPDRMPNRVAILRYSPDGRTLAVGLCSRTSAMHSRSSIRLLDSNTALPLGPELSFQTGLWSLAFSPDGNRLAAGFSDGNTQVYSMPAGNPVGRPLHEGTTLALAATASGRLALGTGLGEVTIRAPATGRISQVLSFRGKGIHSLAFAPNERTLAVGTGYPYTTSGGPPTAEVWTYDTVLGTRIGAPIRVGGSRAFVHRFSQDGSTLYTKSAEENTQDFRSLRLWDARTGKNLGRDLAGDSDTTDMAVTIDDAIVLQVDRRGRVLRRSIEDGRSLGEPWLLQPQGIDRILIAPDGHSFVTSAADGTVRLWDIETGSPLGPPIEHDFPIRGAFAIGPDGRTLATSVNPGILRFWDARTGLQLGPSRTQGSSDDFLLFLPRGGQLAISQDPSVVCLVPVPVPIRGDLESVRHWAEARAGWTIDAAGSVARLSAAEWARRCTGIPARESGVGGRDRGPGDETDRHLGVALASRLDRDFHAVRWHLDRVLAAGSDDPALWLERAIAHAELKHADLALDDLEKALDLKPGRPTEWTAMFSMLCTLPENRQVKEFGIKAVSRWEKTRAPLDEARTPVVAELAARCGASRRWDLVTAVLEEFIFDPESDLGIRQEDDSLAGKYAIALLRKGDQAAYRLFCRKRQAQLTARKWNVRPLDVLWDCVIGPDAIGDPNTLVRQAETALKTTPPAWRAEGCRVLGAALYRAGRFDESISRIDESIRLRQGKSLARDWAFLAMAHARKGNHAEAVVWLNRLPSFQPPDGPDRFWEEQRMIIHSQEAAAVVLYDPIFPADPFAR
jgi:serine/threonine protein kinase/WD40 repeat protein/tetratricopeptide (TPR) repeat protein